MKEYKEMMRAMHAQINSFVNDHAVIENELMDRQKEFMKMAFPSGINAGQLFFDWFIFDYILRKPKRRLFDVFLSEIKSRISPSFYEVYSRLGNDRFGIFKVKAVKSGKQFVCLDSLSGREYHVYETSLTKSISKGDYVIGRLLPFEEAYIVASHCVVLERQKYDMFGCHLNMLQFAAPRRIDAVSVYKCLFPSPVPETLPVKEKFELLCKEGGLSDEDIEDIYMDMRKGIKNSDALPQQVLLPVIEKMRQPEWFDMEEFYQAFVEVWNTFAGEIHKGVPKGPNELMLLEMCLEHLSSEFLGSRPLSAVTTEMNTQMRKWADDWFNRPLEELGGLTPKEVILFEREERGNPQKDFKFEFTLSAVGVDSAYEKKAEKYFNEANDLMSQGRYEEALKVYGDYLILWDGNHVVWHNMAVCYVMLLKKQKAEKCLKRALVLKPDYELALRKWEELRSMCKEDMVFMVRQIRKSREKQKKIRRKRNKS